MRTPQLHQRARSGSASGRSGDATELQRQILTQQEIIQSIEGELERARAQLEAERSGDSDQVVLLRRQVLNLTQQADMLKQRLSETEHDLDSLEAEFIAYRQRYGPASAAAAAATPMNAPRVAHVGKRGVSFKDAPARRRT